VSNESPLKAEVDDLVGAHLASVGAICGSADVLGSYEDFGVEHRFGGGDVEGDRGDNNFNAVLVELHGVESVRAKIANKVNGAIALPVASNDELSLGGCFDHSDYMIWFIL